MAIGREEVISTLTPTPTLTLALTSHTHETLNTEQGALNTQVVVRYLLSSLSPYLP